MRRPSQLKVEFIHAYKKWLDEGAPPGKPFHRFDGLCFNYMRYIKFGLGDLGLFTRAYPFGGRSTYHKESNGLGSCHENKARIKWVNKFCKKYPITPKPSVWEKTRLWLKRD